MTTCDHPDCAERIWPGSMECEAKPPHRQSTPAPIPPEQAVHKALFYLRVQIRDGGEPDMLAYMEAEAAGLNAALVELREYHELRAALATIAVLMEPRGVKE